MKHSNNSTNSVKPDKLDSGCEQKLDEICKKIEKHYQDDDFQSYIAPLLNPDTLTDEKIYNLERVLEYYEKYGILLPLIDDPRYELIKNYNDFEFTNCIAYEMAIRTDKFQKAKFILQTIEDIKYVYPFYNRASDDEVKTFIQNMKESLQYLHSDIKKIVSKHLDNKDANKNINKMLENILLDLGKERDSSLLMLKDMGILNVTSFLSQDMLDFTNGKFILLDQKKRSLTLSDFRNGLELLITFYLPKEMIYKKVDKNSNFEKLVNNNVEEIVTTISENINSYYIYISSNFIPLSILSKVSISIFDSEFMDMLKKHYSKYQYIDVQPNYTRPLLHFINAKIINLPINLNFSKNELISLVSKIKDDYDNKESLVKTPIEFLGEKLEKFKIPNSEKKLPSKAKQDKKIAFANAFCVYDLDKVLTPIFNKNKKETREYEDNSICSKEALKSEISSITGLNEDTIKVYRTLMKEYINREKFTELITGISQTKK